MKKDFKISSGLKDIIGKELITDDFIAIFELVKNSYDANAKNVHLTFSSITDPLSPDAKIVIVDDGEGMNDKDLEDKWLFVGYSEKKEADEGFRDKIHKKRIFAGAKGIGRFSCDRLGKRLRLVTRKQKTGKFHVLDVDWKKFEEDQSKEFQKVHVDYTEEAIPWAKKEEFEDFRTGAILEISGLNDLWDREKLLKLKRYLQRLINPTQIDKKDDFTIHIHAGEFIEEDRKNKDGKKGEFSIVNGPVKNVVFEKLPMRTTMLECYIDETGENITTKLVDKEVFIFSIKEKNEYRSLRNISIKLFYLNTVAKQEFSRIMGISSTSYGSIFLYKNGFRIHPYGDPQDDWLDLERRKGQGLMRRIAGRDLLGRVEILGFQQDFKEVSSRDGGIIKNTNYLELREFIFQKVLKRLEKYVVEGIYWDSEKIPKTPEEIKQASLEVIQKLAGQVKDPEKEIDFNPVILDIFKKKEMEKIPEVIKNVEKLIEHAAPAVRKKAESQLKSLRASTKQLQKDAKENEDEKTELQAKVAQKEKEILFYSDVNPGGVDMKSFFHTVGHTTFYMGEVIAHLMKNLETMKPLQIREKLEEIKLENDKIRTMSRLISRAGFNTQSSIIRNDLSAYLSQYIKHVSAINERDLRLIVTGEDVFNMKFRPLEISIIIDNFISNAKKAGARRMLFRTSKEKKEFKMLVHDDGKGVKKEMLSRLFKLGATSTRGSGIGLYHIKKIVERAGGKVKFVGNFEEEGYPGACFEVTFGG